MSRARLFQGGRVASADSAPAPADVLVDAAGCITAVEAGLTPPADAECVDCTGRILLPGLFDMHIHLREPGREDQETIQSGTEAAINGGITGVLAMPNTHPAIDSGGMVRFIQALARDQARIPVYTAGAITQGREGASLAEIADMQAQGAVMIAEGGSPIVDPYLLRRAMEYASTFDMLIASHCEVPALNGEGAMHEGAMSYHLGVPGLPACSEEICLERDVRLAAHTTARLHIQQLSTGEGVDIIRRARERGIRVTCEVTPHHLIFSEDDLAEYDTNFKMRPPLRTREDNALLLQGLKDGVIDCIASGHAPHTGFEKARDFVSAPGGVTGLDTALLGLYTHLIKDGHMGWDLLVQAFCDNPRELLGIDPVRIAPGQPAEFVVFQPDAVTPITRETMRSRSYNNPFIGRELDGAVEQVVLGNDLLKEG